MSQASVIALAVFCVLMTTAGQIALKTGVSAPALTGLLASGETMAFFMRALLTPVVIGGLVLYGAGAVLWLLVLARADLSYAYPLISLGFVVSAFYAHFGMNESLDASRMIGIALIVAGVIFVARS